MSVWIGIILRLVSSVLRFFFFFFFFFWMHAFQLFETKCIVYGTHNHFIQKKKNKNGSHNTIYTFKNYFATVFSVFSKISCIQTDPKWEFKNKTKWNKLFELFGYPEIGQITDYPPVIWPKFKLLTYSLKIDTLYKFR